MNDLTQSIGRQTAILFANIGEIIDALDETQLSEEGSWGWSLGEQIYHLLHSLDQWFINPYMYEESAWAHQQLSKQDLRDYNASIQSKITRYLDALDDRSLGEHPKDCPFTRLDLILGQHRHLMYHIGLIHGCLRSETGHSPEFVGLSNPVAPIDK